MMQEGFGCVIFYERWGLKDSFKKWCLVKIEKGRKNFIESGRVAMRMKLEVFVVRRGVLSRKSYGMSFVCS